MRLVAENVNDVQISRSTAVPRETVRDWRRRRVRAGTQRELHVAGKHDFSELPAGAYSYLLGLYLGDGCLSQHAGSVWRLRITMDSRYPNIVAEACAAIEAVMPGQRAHRGHRRGCIDVSLYSKHWPCLFPQHGPGKKHTRSIVLAPWQEAIVVPQLLIRGLIHSDGCRVAILDRGCPSVRYHFSNLSEDIKRIYCWALDQLEIPWTRPSDRDIAVYRQAAVRRMDTFVGPKT